MPKRILLVEDEVEVAELFQLFLSREGYEVKVANDGERAAELLRTESFDLMITDLFMPKKDGLELIKDVQKKGNMKVIAISGGAREMGTQVFLETAKFMGAVKTFEKPFDCHELVAAVRELLA